MRNKRHRSNPATITENGLIKMGWRKVTLDDEPGYYYVYEINTECVLITNDSVGANEVGWRVELHDIIDGCVFTKLKELSMFIDLIERNLVDEVD